MRHGQLPGPTELIIRTSGPVPARLSSVRTPQRRPTRKRDAKCPFRKRHCRPNRGRGTRIPSRWSLPPVWPMLVGASSPRIPDARRGEPQTLCREAFSFRSLADLHESDTNLTTNCRPNQPQTRRWPAFALVIGLVEPPAGIEPATPSLPWNHREPLCGPPFPQVPSDRRGRSYRFSFSEVMRSLSNQVLSIAGEATIRSDPVEVIASNARIASASSGSPGRMLCRGAVGRRVVGR